MIYNNQMGERSEFSSDVSWKLIESYFDKNYLEQLVRHQLESYNDFVNIQIQKTIEMFNPITIRSENTYDSDTGKYPLEIIITFDNFTIYRPRIHENNGATKLMMPHEARARNFTYGSIMNVDINIKYIILSGVNLENSQTIIKTIPKINIGKLPIMLKSCICVLNQHNFVDNRFTGECRSDPGGYFIINGTEKTVICQERAAANRIYCFKVQKQSHKWEWMAEIKSVPDYKQISPKQINMYISSKSNGFGKGIYIQLPRTKQPIPIFIIYRALGIISDKDICSQIMLNITDAKLKKMLFALKASIIDANSILTQEDAITYITQIVNFQPINMTVEQGKIKKRQFTIDVLKNDLFPHCHSEKQKIYFLGLMTNKLLKTSFGWRKVDDRDSYINKRIDACGILLNNLFRNYFNKLVKDIQKQVIKEINTGSWRSNNDYINIINLTNIYKIVKSSTIENGFKRALATGDFGIKQNNSNKVGVAQVLNRLTYISSLSHLRRVNTPIDKSGKLIPPRKLHSTSWGYLCPAETPEGQSVGVVKNLSYMSHLTIPSDSSTLFTYVKPHIISLDEIDHDIIYGKVKVFINGSWIGIADDPMKLYNDLKNKKYRGIVNIYTSISFDYTSLEIHICSDSGRLVRPVYRVKNNKLYMNDAIISQINSRELLWDDVITSAKIDDSLIEYIDPLEQNFSLICIKPNNLDQCSRYSHCEIHPSTIFGILASCIPFPEHNQSPRNTYQCAMGKQAMGMYVTNYDNRMDKTAYVLTNPMRPLVDTRIMNMLKLNDIPSGETVIVAIMTHSGYNQEDSILFNKGSVDRGLFQATLYSTEKDEDKKAQGDQEIRCKPNPHNTSGIKFGNYNKLTSNGIVPENTLLQKGDVLIGKVVPIKENKNDNTTLIKYKDESRIFRGNENTYVDKNYIERNGDGYTFCKTRLRTMRTPVIGDKFSSRHGQKGTIGNIIPEEDMPFTSSGLKPDIIINPHAIPSRMTIAQLKETLLGKVLVEFGLFGDGTSFGEYDIKKICNELLKIGYEAHGNELLYNGLTGEQIETSIFIGPCFYQRLKHMVSDKQHSRSQGPMVNLTRQPAEGRSRDGGLRFGEMERDCMVSHGASAFTKERVYDASDKFEVYVCNKCGMIASVNHKMQIYNCNMCDNKIDFARVKIPYSCKLLFQELITMNVAPRILAE